MIRSTRKHTNFRGWFLWWPIFLVLGVSASQFVSQNLYGLLLVGMPVIAAVGWAVLIALDVRAIKIDANLGPSRYLYPILAVFSALGVLLYLYEREKKLKKAGVEKV